MAQTEVEILLPGDAQITWSKTQPDCRLMQWRSRILQQRYPTSGGYAFAAFQGAPDKPYHDSDVQDVYLEARNTSPDDYPNC
jgi:hypothetical protein